MKQSFQQNKDIFNILFEAASEGIIVVNKEHQIVAANIAAAQMFGYAVGELVDQPLNLLIPTEYQAQHPRHVDQFIATGASRQMGHGRDLYGIKKNGDRFPVEAGLNPFEIAGERFVMSLVIDISIRKETQQQIKELNTRLEEKIRIRTSELSQSVQQLQRVNIDLEGEIQRRKEAEGKLKIALQQEIELNELKTKFLSLVSHEFKTPLSGILSSATLIGKYTREEQQGKKRKASVYHPE